MDKELVAIQRVRSAVKALTTEEQIRVLQYVQQGIYEGLRKTAVDQTLGGGSLRLQLGEQLTPAQAFADVKNEQNARESREYANQGR